MNGLIDGCMDYLAVSYLCVKFEWKGNWTLVFSQLTSLKNNIMTSNLHTFIYVYIYIQYIVLLQLQKVCYNDILAHTRAMIECTFWQLKGHWMCLDIAGGKFLHTPEKVFRIILACCVLHNLDMAHSIPSPPGAEPQAKCGASWQGCSAGFLCLNAACLVMVS